MDPFSFTVDDFDIDWLRDGPRAGTARGFNAKLDYTTGAATSRPKHYDLRVNHPLTIGDTDLFLIGHGYAPVITVRDAQGNVEYSKPIRLPAAGPGLLLLRRRQGAVREARAIGLEGSSTRRSPTSTATRST